MQIISDVELIEQTEENKELIDKIKQDQEQKLKDINYAIDLNTGDVKQNTHTAFIINNIYPTNKNTSRELHDKLYSYYLENIQDFKKDIQKYKNKTYKTIKPLQNNIYIFNKMFDVVYYNGFNLRVKDLLNDSIKNAYIEQRARAFTQIQCTNIVNMDIKAFLECNTKDLINNSTDIMILNASDLTTIQQQMIKVYDNEDTDKNTTNLYNFIYDIILNLITNEIQQEIQDNYKFYGKLHQLYQDIDTDIKEIINNFKSASDKLNAKNEIAISKSYVKLPPNYSIDFDIMRLFNNIYPNYKFKSIDADRHKKIDIKAQLMFDLDINNTDNLEDIRLLNFIREGNIQLYPIQSALITNFIRLRDYNNTDKAIPLLSALKYTTENKDLRLPTRKRDLDLYEDFMLFFNKCKIQIKIFNRATGEVYFEILKPIPLLANTPAYKEGKYGYIIGNSVINILKNELDNLNDTPKQTTHLLDKQYLTPKTKSTPPMINLIQYIYPKIASMINTYKTKNKYQSKIDITCLYDFQAMYNKHPRATKEDKRDVRDMVNEYLEQLIQKQLITSYKPILKGKEINTYQIIINKNAKI